MPPFFFEVYIFDVLDGIKLLAAEGSMLLTMWVLWSVVGGINNFGYLLHFLLCVGA